MLHPHKSCYSFALSLASVLRRNKREGAVGRVVLFPQGHKDCLFSKAKLIQTHSTTTKNADVKNRNHHLLVPLKQQHIDGSSYNLPE